MDEPITIPEDHPVIKLMDEFSKKANEMNLGYALAVDVIGEGWHATKTNADMDAYFFAVFHTALDMGAQRKMTKKEVLDCIKEQVEILEGEINE